jgi:hypothetical protein
MADNVFRLELPVPLDGLTSVNTYLIPGDTGVIVTGTRSLRRVSGPRAAEIRAHHVDRLGCHNGDP